LASGFSSGLGEVLLVCPNFLLSLSRADVSAALVESGSTADNSTADGVLLVGRAVAVRGSAFTADEVVGLLNRPSNADFCVALMGFLDVNILGSSAWLTLELGCNSIGCGAALVAGCEASPGSS